MDRKNSSAPSCAQIGPARRLIAAGIIRRSPGRTLTVRVTQAGVTGTIRTAASAPSCCGRPMRRDGSQYVCGRCGAWTDPGITGLAPKARTFDDDSDDVCPICERWICTCGSTNRLGLRQAAGR
ncbi:hypothetical protein [Streptomyces sp. NPDC020996]|uniref:hypothetical protein n=1 Tax=Streptomyces sp. NPDC020996 TaxID=3154791 RepID=UPI0033C3CA52